MSGYGDGYPVNEPPPAVTTPRQTPRPTPTPTPTAPPPPPKTSDPPKETPRETPVPAPAPETSRQADSPRQESPRQEDPQRDENPPEQDNPPDDPPQQETSTPMETRQQEIKASTVPSTPADPRITPPPDSGNGNGPKDNEWVVPTEDFSTYVNLGALTSRIQFHSLCSENLYSVEGQSALGAPYQYNTAGCLKKHCCPSSQVYTQDWAWMTSYYSPAVCPKGYKTCEAYGGIRTDALETAAFCCPGNYACPKTKNNVNGGITARNMMFACESFISDDFPVTVINNFQDQKVITTKLEMPDGPVAQIAYPIQIRFKSAELSGTGDAQMIVTSLGNGGEGNGAQTGDSATLPQQTGAPQNNGGADGELSTGTKVGIGLGVALGVLLLILCLLIFCIPAFRRRIKGAFTGNKSRAVDFESDSRSARTESLKPPSEYHDSNAENYSERSSYYTQATSDSYYQPHTTNPYNTTHITDVPPAVAYSQDTKEPRSSVASHNTFINANTTDGMYAGPGSMPNNALTTTDYIPRRPPRPSYTRSRSGSGKNSKSAAYSHPPIPELEETSPKPGIGPISPYNYGSNDPRTPPPQYINRINIRIAELPGERTPARPVELPGGILEQFMTSLQRGGSVKGGEEGEDSYMSSNRTVSSKASTVLNWRGPGR